MEVFSNGLSRSVNYLSTMGISDFLDIIIVAYLIYKAIGFVRRTNSNNLAKGLVVFLLALWGSDIFSLTMINFLLRKTAELGLIALLILFQPELRRLLERMGSGFASGRSSSGTVMDSAISQTVQACCDMSDSKTGALIIFERGVALNSIISTGTVINADTTAELLKNMFFNKAPLHDGAVIIRDGRIAAAGCVLPLTQRTNLSKDLGMRHRAGIGLSEESDAVIIVVSEETGAISAAMDGMLKRHLSGEALDKLLRSELIREEDSTEKHGLIDNIRNFFKVNANVDEKQDEENL
ncbi:MAG: diadenylate cyclase CdaA [Candidatus Limivicinus sp.]|nr:diadenylate cyclase CdaA [Clostridiales bacterium]MDY4225159.1 diadenylate cyclase CdaA [Candidatus Limivicinus sp.]MDY5082897.1 diadenylate cyclase CdaA [Candidatus Limivicinus sp.]